MRSGTSFFNKTLIRTDIRRYWPVLFAYTAVWMSLPLTQWTEAKFFGIGSGDYFAGDTIYDMMPAAIAIALVFGCMMAMAVFSYLTNSRSVGLMHSLPVRRTTHFASHVASALGMFVVANVFVALLTLLVQVLTGYTAPMDVLVWLAVSTMLDIIFFSMAVVCCMFTGWLLAVPVLYGALNCFVWVVQMLLQALGGLFYFGYRTASPSDAVMWCTPVMKLVDTLSDRYFRSPTGVLTSAQREELYPGRVLPRCLGGETWQTLVIYTVVAVVLLVLSWVLYRRRASESAADPVAFGWAKPIFRYGIALLGGLALGLGLYFILSLNSNYLQMPLLIVCLVIMGAICYFAAAMVISKSFKVFKSGWKGAVAVGVVLMVVCIVTKMDPTGFTNRIPEQEDVENVAMSASMDNYIPSDQYCADPEVIAAVLEGHKAILDYGERTDYANGWFSIFIRYDLKNGTTMYRTYNLDEEQVRNTPELKDALEQMLNQEEIRRTRITGRAYPLTEQEHLWGGYAELYGNGKDVHMALTEEEATAFYEALERDIQNGAGQIVIGAVRPTVQDMRIDLTTDQRDININSLPADATEALAVLEEVLKGADVTLDDLINTPDEGFVD